MPQLRCSINRTVFVIQLTRERGRYLKTLGHGEILRCCCRRNLGLSSEKLSKISKSRNNVPQQDTETNMHNFSKILIQVIPPELQIVDENNDTKQGRKM